MGVTAQLSDDGRAVSRRCQEARDWLDNLRARNTAIERAKGKEKRDKGKQREEDAESRTPIASERVKPRLVLATQPLPTRKGDDSGESEAEEVEEAEAAEEEVVTGNIGETGEGEGQAHDATAATDPVKAKLSKIALEDLKVFKLAGQYAGLGATRQAHKVWIKVSRNRTCTHTSPLIWVLRVSKLNDRRSA